MVESRFIQNVRTGGATAGGIRDLADIDPVAVGADRHHGPVVVHRSRGSTDRGALKETWREPALGGVGGLHDLSTEQTKHLRCRGGVSRDVHQRTSSDVTILSDKLVLTLQEAP